MIVVKKYIVLGNNDKRDDENCADEKLTTEKIVDELVENNLHDENIDDKNNITPAQNTPVTIQTTNNKFSKAHVNADNVMTPDFFKYIEKFGYHFSDKLANHVSKYWNCDSAMENLGSALVKSVAPPITLGDLTYYSDFLYSKFYPSLFTKDRDSLKFAYRVLKDYSYKEAAFNHFISDLIGEGNTIEWSEFLEN